MGFFLSVTRMIGTGQLTCESSQKAVKGFSIIRMWRGFGKRCV